MVNTALPDIDSSLHVGPTLLPWVMTAYAIAFAGVLLLGGQAADVLGRRRVFAAGVALYGLGSLVASLARDRGTDRRAAGPGPGSSDQRPRGARP